MQGSARSAAGVVAILMGMAMPSSAAPRPAGSRPAPGLRVEVSTYRNLKTDDLVRQLQAMGMTELLRSLSEQLGTSDVASMEALAALETSEGLRMTEDLDARKEHLLKAKELRAKMVEVLAERIKEPNSYPDRTRYYEDKIKYLRVKFKLADLIGRTLPEPYADRLLYLRGSQEDRNEIIRLTGEATRYINELSMENRGEIPKLLTELRGSRMYAIWVSIGPDLEEMDKTVRYYSAWIYLYRGMALPELDKNARFKDQQEKDEMERAAAERNRLLRSAITKAEPFAKDDESGVKHWARICIGRAHRELREPNDADRALEGVAKDPTAETDARVNALFEHVRNAIEHARLLAKDYGNTGAAEAKFKEAAGDDLKLFQNEGSKLLGESGRIGIEVKSVLLKNYLYETWASCTSGSAADGHKKEAQKALVDFIIAHPQPEVLRALFDIFGPKYRDIKDYDKLSSVSLLCVTGYYFKLREAEKAKDPNRLSAEEKDAQGRKLDEDRKEIVDRLNAILDRKQEDPAVQRVVVPIAEMYRGALAMESKEREGREQAGDSFLKAAKQQTDPTVPAAYSAASNAVKCYWMAVQEYLRSRDAAPGALREKFIDAAEFLTSKDVWLKKPEVEAWFFQLAWMCDESARTETGDAKKRGELADKALKYYKRVPASDREYVRAQHMRLELAVWFTDRLPPGKEKTDRATELIKELKGFGAAFRKAADDANKAGDAKRAGDCLAWGARAAFQEAAVEYEILNRPAEAMKALDQIPKDWPGTPSLLEAGEYQIRKLIEQKKTKEATEKAGEFTMNYPAEAPRVLQVVSQQIRERIAELQSQDPEPPELKTYRDNYLEFAKKLFELGRAKDANEDSLYKLRQLLGDALLQQKDPNLAREALVHFEEARKIEEKGLQSYRDAIDSEYKGKTDKLAEAHERADLLPLLKEYLKVKAEYKLDDTAAFRALERAMGSLNDPKDPNKAASIPTTEMKARIGTAVEFLKKAYEDQCEKRKRIVATDMENAYGFARAYRLLKDYVKADEGYKSLLRMIDPRTDRARYLDVQIEHCDCTLEGRSDDKKTKRAILDLIKQWRIDFEVKADTPVDRRLQKLEQTAKYGL